MTNTFHYYASIMKLKTEILLLVMLLFLSCSRKEIKPPRTHLENPEEPLVINIRETDKEKNIKILRGKISSIVEKLPLQIKIGQLIMSYPPSCDNVKKHQIGGIILNQNFIKDTLSTKTMIDEYNKQTLIPLFFAIDQEGGKVNRLKHIPGYEKTPSAKKLGTSFTKRDLLEYGYRTAATMSKLGINMNLAPSLDLSENKNSLMYRQERSLGGKPVDVKQKAESLIKGYKAGGILVVAKHYPGYSDVKINSDVTTAHFELPSIQMLRNFNIFSSLANEIDGVMNSSVIYGDFDSVPALYSKSLIELIRIPNPDILVMTDDLYAPALRMLDNENLTMITTRAFVAGNDILLIMWDIKVPILLEGIKGTLQTKPELMSQLDESLTRILLAKERIYPGLIEKLHSKWIENIDSPGD